MIHDFIVNRKKAKKIFLLKKEIKGIQKKIHFLFFKQ